VTDVLHRIQKLEKTESEQNLTSILDALGLFHKQASKAKEESVESGWFLQIINSKKYINKLLESKKKALMSKTIKLTTRIEYPLELWEGKTAQYKEVIKSLYKHFLVNMDEQILTEKNKIS
jgi:hypothetical protein